MILQTELSQQILAILKSREPEFKFMQRHYDAIYNASGSIIEELHKSPVTPGMGLEAWLDSDETGSSSMYMAYILAPEAPKCEYAHPLNSTEFSQCQKLLGAVPELESRLHKMAQCPGIWSRLILDWHLISDLIENGNKVEADKLIQSHVRSYKENPA